MKNINPKLTAICTRGVCQRGACTRNAEYRIYSSINIEGVYTPVFEYCEKHVTDSLMLKDKVGFLMPISVDRNGSDFFVTMIFETKRQVGMVSLYDHQVDLREVSEEIVNDVATACNGTSKVLLNGMCLTYYYTKEIKNNEIVN